MKTIIILPLLVLVVLTSGCSIPGLDFIFGGPAVVEYEHDILIIKNLQAIPSEVAPGQQFRIIAYIQNIGDDSIPQTGDYGLEKIDASKREEFIIELYDYAEGLFTILDINNCDEGNIIRERPDDDPEVKDVATGEPVGCRIKRILPNQIIEIDWILKASDDIKLETHLPRDGMKILVRYPYRTMSLTTITVMDENEMQRQIEEGTIQWIDSYIVKGQGPIKPVLYVEDKQPISQGSGSSVFSLQIENKGTGYLVNKVEADGGTTYENLLPSKQIIITLPGGMGPKTDGDCNFEGGNNGYTIKDEGTRLIYGKSPKLLCEVNLPTGKNIPKVTTLHATVDIEYEYEFRDSVNVAVIPKI